MTAWPRRQKPKDLYSPVGLDPEIVENKLKDFIATKSKLITVSDIDKNTKVFSSGLLDSLAYIELVLFVEREFRVKLSKMTEVNMNSMDSVAQIVETVRQCLAQEQPVK
jgi:acyl carrier protein